MREGLPSLLLMITTLPTTRPPNPFPTREVVFANRVLHCSLVSKASLADSLIGPPSACLSSVHITHAHSAWAVAVDVSRQNATSTDVRHATRIIGCPPSLFITACHAARCVACHGVRSPAVPVALGGECSIPLV